MRRLIASLLPEPAAFAAHTPAESADRLSGIQTSGYRAFCEPALAKLAAPSGSTVAVSSAVVRGGRLATQISIAVGMITRRSTVRWNRRAIQSRIGAPAGGVSHTNADFEALASERARACWLADARDHLVERCCTAFDGKLDARLWR